MPEIDERVATLEADHKYLREKVDAMSEKLDEMHTVFLQAKGAQWVIVSAAALGGFLAGKLGFIASLFTAK